MAPTLSEASRSDHPVIHVDDIVPLDFESVQTVPDSHLWHNSNGIESDEWSSVPVIDLAGPDAAYLMGLACETWGVFQVTNHGIPLDLMDEVESEARRLFSLPAGQKLKALRSSSGGATGYGMARIAPFFDKCMWHEGFTIFGSALDHAKLLWPCDYQRFCDVMQDYQKRMKELASSILHQILKSSGSSEEETNRLLCATQGVSPALQLNSYPICPDPKRTMGLAPHTDTSLLTILHQNDVVGLQVLREGVGWELVRPTKGALVVNVGDLLHILSNARFPCVLHRVVLKEAYKQRLSVAFFSNLPLDLDLCPMGLRFDDQSPKYRTVSVQEYLGIKATSLDKALSLIRN